MIQKEKAFSAKSHVKGDMPEPKRFSKPPVRRKTSKWAVKAASEIENQAVDTALEGELSKMSVSVASKPMGGAKKKMPTKKTSKSKFKRPLPPQETSPFHYSPIKTPPRAAAPPPPEVIFKYYYYLKNTANSILEISFPLFTNYDSSSTCTTSPSGKI